MSLKKILLTGCITGLLLTQQILANNFSFSGNFEIAATNSSNFAFGDNILGFNTKIADKYNVTVELKHSEGAYEDLVDAVFIANDNWSIGKQGIPFGTFEAATLTATFTKDLEDYGSIGMVYNQELSGINTAIALFNGTKANTLGSSGQISLAPINNITIGGSILLVQEAADIRQDISINSSYSQNQLKIITEVFYGLAGSNKEQMVYNLGGSYNITNTIQAAIRYDGTNETASIALNKKNMITLCANYDLGSGLILSGEYNILTDNANHNTNTFTTKLALEF